MKNEKNENVIFINGRRIQWQFYFWVT